MKQYKFTNNVIDFMPKIYLVVAKSQWRRFVIPLLKEVLVTSW